MRFPMDLVVNIGLTETYSTKRANAQEIPELTREIKG
jgi:hypothetical protein